MKRIEKHRLNNNWSYAQKIWQHKKKEHKLHNWSLRLMHAADKAGLCSYTEKIIYISSVFMRGHNCNYDKVKKTLMHEIAHALKPGHGHGKKWKEKCRQRGGNSRLAVTMVLQGMNWAMVCPTCGWRQEYRSKPNATGMVCGKCSTSIRVKYIH